MFRHSLTHPTRTARIVVLAWLLAMLLAQTLGLIHRGAHIEGMRKSSAATAHAHFADSRTHASTRIEALFNGHTADADCRLYDAIGQVGCAPAATVLVHVTVFSTFIIASGAEFKARWSALFDARGPPPSH
ncbi:hypothetical protein [Ramlibacter sp.]|uniref:hypothetical protein n=1 Tax=Ramlibacter sp. TaxID=1917967 RepID=UPI003D125D8A